MGIIANWYKGIMPKPKGATPVMKQFWDAKKSHPDSLMLFRMGDFYETFEKDAEIASEVLGITLTKRANGAASTVPLAGFPYHALEQYLHKLLKAGHRVAICEQVEDPKLAKGIVKREVLEVITPGTSLSEKYLDRNENNYLASLFILSDCCGIAFLDISTGEFQTGEIHKKEILNTLRQYDPKEVLIPEEQREVLKSILGGNRFFITTCQDWIWEEAIARDELTEVFGVNSLKGYGIDTIPLAIGSAGAATHYLRTKLMRKLDHLSGIKCIRNTDTMMLDASTMRNLEIFTSLSTQGIHGTLIGVLDKTVTAAGSRMLKQWIREPLTDISTINDRLNLVQEFLGNDSLRETIRLKLREVSDIHRILSRLSSERATPRDVYQLGRSLEILTEFRMEIPKSSNSISDLLEQSKDTTSIVDSIYKTIVEDPPVTTNKGRYIQTGYSKELDELRSMADNAADWLVKYQESERKNTGISSLKIGFNRVFGYYIDVTKTHQDKVPDHYIRKQTLTNSERYFTAELKEYEEKILSSEEKMVIMEGEIFYQLREKILSFSSDIYHNTEILAKLDIVSSLAEVACKNDYCRPEFSAHSELIIKDSRHPVVEQLLPLGEDFIPNDVELDQKTRQIAIITGPNMAGKSTFLRQVGLTVIMAQIGSFVPAEKARIGVVDKLFTRVGASDNLAGGESTFMVEMNETANILNNATPNSLVLLDEIGRGTSTYDGLSIAWAVTEYLHNKEKTTAMTMFATHYHELAELANELPKAFNLTVDVKEFGNRVVFLRKIKPGGADRSYGIHVAEMAGIPKPVIARSNEILNQLLSSEKTTPETSLSVMNADQIGLFETKDSELLTDLEQIDINQMTPMEAMQKLNDLKEKHGI